MKNWQITIILGIMVLIFFWPHWLNSYPVVFGDNLYMNFPLKLLAFDLIKQGTLPLWNPYVFSGYPLLASMQAGIFYPPNWLFLILPPAIAFNINLLIPYFMGSLGMFFYCKQLNKSSFASLFAAITFIFSSFMIFKMENIPLIQEVSLIPFILILLEKARTTRLNIFTLLAGGLFGLSLLAGHPQISFYTGLIIVIYQSYFYFANRTSNDRINYVTNGIVVLLSGLLLSAIQLIPTIQLALLSGRTELSFADYSFGSWPPVGIFSLLFPYIAGGSFNNGLYSDGLFNQFDSIGNFCCYAGILPLLFMIFAIIKNKDNHYLRVWLIIAIVGILLALGSYQPLHYILYKIPVFNFFRYPARYMLLFNIGICVISSFGINEVLNIEKDKFIKYLKIIFSGMLILSIIAIVFLLRVNTTEEASRISLFSANIIIPLVTITLSGVSLVYYFMKRTNLARLAIMSVLVFDLFICFAQFSGWRSEYNNQISCLKEIPPVANFLKQNLKPDERFITIHKEKALNHSEFNLVEPDYSMLFNLNSINGYDVLTIKRYSLLFNSLMIGHKDDLKFNFNSGLVDLLSCKFFVTREDTFSYYTKSLYFSWKWDHAFSHPGVVVFQNNSYLPKVIAVKNYKVFDDTNQVLEYINKSAEKSITPWKPAKIALLEEEFVKNISFKPSQRLPKATIEITEYTIDAVTIKIKSDSDVILILNDTYYPFWKATVDGKKTTVFPVNLALRAIVVPEGEHIVQYKIKDLWFVFGAIISVLTLIFFIAAFVYLKKFSNFVSPQVTTSKESNLEKP